MNTALFASSRVAATRFQGVQITLPAGLRALLRRATTTSAPAAAAVQELHAGAIARIARPLGRTISCAAGTLWLTFDNEPQDVILEAGQSYRCAKASRLLIQALDSARWSVA